MINYDEALMAAWLDYTMGTGIGEEISTDFEQGFKICWENYG